MRIPAIGIFRMPAAYRLADADTTSLNPEQVAEARTEPAWCDDCMPAVEGFAIHSGLVGVVTDIVDGEPHTVEVRIERNDHHGRPGKAFVALREVEGDRVEFGPTAALQLADLYAQAARLAIRDQAGGVR